MEKRQIGSSDLHSSVIGLGCMSLDPGNPAENKRIIDEAVELGINYFDTADLYDFGKNEEIVGSVLAHRRKDIILATKGGNRWNEDKDSWRWDPSKAYIKEAVKGSLRRLRTDYIDLYQLHGGTIDDHMDETIEAFDDLVKEGTVRFYGISSIRPNVIRYYAEHSKIVSVMMQYSLLDRRPEEMFSLLEDKNISVLARGPVAKGMLSDKVQDMDGSRSFLKWRAEDVKQRMLKVKEELKDYRIHEAALQYVLSSGTVASAVTGASSIEQIRQNASAGMLPHLSDGQKALLSELFPFEPYKDHR
ncbi:aldo/keto reductase [Fictibacillus aquaticus]|jgi:aryl-alcohol dehydrogenase-like predicted oxidoreductase|uniref:Oxidoreductase n=1 Tax=Fictibacillus aquaticus TaxID=2021314 RepID=A0A235FBR9_9BACL|nr:aldo/keto reductase [Fictibacillus aquaticus]OYD58383.1 oxidoreductase [Fictibacillus aquaticus]